MQFDCSLRTEPVWELSFVLIDQACNAGGHLLHHVQQVAHRQVPCHGVRDDTLHALWLPKDL